jgi:aldehyde:ferredoxin oxidoreductase
MPSILVANLSEGTIERTETDFSEYGRGLAVRLLREYTPVSCQRLSPENAFVIAPGLLTGVPVPCATRAAVAARGGATGEIAASSITGDLPQKLASLGIAALVVLGKSVERNSVILLEGQTAQLLSMPDLQGMDCGELVAYFRENWGSDCAVAGCGPAADLQLPLSGFFTTYPEGTPRYTCPRSSFGDVPGSKGLRAIVVRQRQCLAAPCANRPELLRQSRALDREILEDPICGSALPGLGSITLLHLLKNHAELPPLPERRPAAHEPGQRVNYCCAPGCVIGCLNRHSDRDGALYAAPEEAEVQAAVNKCFSDALSEEARHAYAEEVFHCGLKLGLNATEFVCTVSLYLEAAGETATPERLRELLTELSKGSAVGRLLGGGTAQIARLYRDNPAIQKRVTRPAVHSQRQFHPRMNPVCPELGQVDDMDLLYREIFLLENLGLCVFSAFALLNRRRPLELLAELAAAKTGTPQTPESLLQYAGQCLEAEKTMQRDSLIAGAEPSIPEFVKVLYRYFEN